MFLIKENPHIYHMCAHISMNTFTSKASGPSTETHTNMCLHCLNPSPPPPPHTHTCSVHSWIGPVPISHSDLTLMIRFLPAFWVRGKYILIAHLIAFISPRDAWHPMHYVIPRIHFWSRNKRFQSQSCLELNYDLGQATWSFWAIVFSIVRPR